MPAYLKLGEIKGEATEQNHKNWIRMQSMSSAVHRSIPSGAVDQQRSRGDTTLADVVVVRDLDSTSVKLVEASANGTYFPSAQIDFCTQSKGKQQVYLTYKLFDVIVSSYSFHGTGSNEPPPSEEVTLAFSKVDWEYTILDPQTADPKGKVPGKYTPGEGKS